MLEIKQKKIFFFDIDNTLFSVKQKQILSQTIKLLKELSNNPNIILSIATGRNKKRLEVLGDILPLFKNFVLLNGAVSIMDDKIIDENPFSQKDIEELIIKIKQHKMFIGMVGLEKEAFIDHKDLKIANLIIDFFAQKRTITENIFDKKFHHYNNVYQIWLLDVDKEKLRNFIKNYNKFEFYYWNKSVGVDTVLKGINKIHGIKQIKAKYPEHQLICIGDGHNDIEMIKYADIGISMKNSVYNLLKTSSNIIAPDIDEDLMYQFFKQYNLI